MGKEKKPWIKRGLSKSSVRQERVQDKRSTRGRDVGLDPSDRERDE